MNRRSLVGHCSRHAHIMFAALALGGFGCQGALILDFSGYTGTPFSDGGNRVIGYTFTVGAQDVVVTQLGYFDEGKDGLVQSHDVGLYADSTRALMTSATVAAGTGSILESWFRMVDVPDVTLSANTTYVLAATCPGTGDTWLWRPEPGTGYDHELLGFALAPQVTVAPAVGAKYIYYGGSAATLAYPTRYDNDNQPPVRNYFIGPNLSFTPAPEPGTTALATALGLGGLVVVRRWRRAKAN